jgi:hypothetical protein
MIRILLKEGSGIKPAAVQRPSRLCSGVEAAVGLSQQLPLARTAVATSATTALMQLGLGAAQRVTI